MRAGEARRGWQTAYVGRVVFGRDSTRPLYSRGKSPRKAIGGKKEFFHRAADLHCIFTRTGPTTIWQPGSLINIDALRDATGFSAQGPLAILAVLFALAFRTRWSRTSSGPRKNRNASRAGFCRYVPWRSPACIGRR